MPTQPESFDFRIHWAEIFNVIVLIAIGVFTWSYGWYLATVQDMAIYTVLVLYLVALILMNATWYFYKGETFVHILSVMAYGTFVLFFGGILATVVLISGTMSEMVAALVAMLFILIPMVLLGLSIWILLRNSFLRAQMTMNYSSLPTNFYDQEAPRMEKVQPQVQYVQVMMPADMAAQFMRQ